MMGSPDKIGSSEVILKFPGEGQLAIARLRRAVKERYKMHMDSQEQFVVKS